VTISLWFSTNKSKLKLIAFRSIFDKLLIGCGECGRMWCA